VRDEPYRFGRGRSIADWQGKICGPVQGLPLGTFSRRERVEVKLISPHIMKIKARSKPSSLYFKFHPPTEP